MDEEDTCVEDEDQLKEMGIKHFSVIFKDDNKTNILDQLNIVHLFPTFLSSEEAESFSTLITVGEVEGDLKYFKRDKSPGPDGWPVELFLVFFDLVRGGISLML